jgi:hypothetical protein
MTWNKRSRSGVFRAWVRTHANYCTHTEKDGETERNRGVVTVVMVVVVVVVLVLVVAVVDVVVAVVVVAQDTSSSIRQRHQHCHCILSSCLPGLPRCLLSFRQASRRIRQICRSEETERDRDTGTVAFCSLPSTDTYARRCMVALLWLKDLVGS